MVIKEFGSNCNHTVMMLHGGGLSWWNYKNAADLLVKNNYHVVLPILNGHADSDKQFTSIEDNAKDIISYIDENFCGNVKILAGLSLGAQILLDILSLRKNICDYAIIESALIYPMHITNMLTAPSINMTYPLIKKQWFAKVQFSSLHLPPELFDDYYQSTCSISKNSMISFLKSNSSYRIKETLTQTKAKTLIMVGKKEPVKMLLSAKKLNKILKGSTLIEFKDFYHGEASIRNYNEYVSSILTFIDKNK